MSKWIEVKTSKRTYRVLPGEQVISIEPHDDDSEGATQ